MNHKRSTNAIVAIAKKKSKETVIKVDQALKELIKKSKRINFNSVSSLSIVSKSYLYNHPEFRERIETLRTQQLQVKSPKAIKHQMSDASKDAIIELLRERIKELDNENKRFKEDNQRLQGKLYEMI
jgi:predicted nuclease with TOPRIM domain